jgi:hypothetical protein
MAYAQCVGCGDELRRVVPINGRAQAAYVQNTGKQEQHHTTSHFARPEVRTHCTIQNKGGVPAAHTAFASGVLALESSRFRLLYPGIW